MLALNIKNELNRIFGLWWWFRTAGKNLPILCVNVALSSFSDLLGLEVAILAAPPSNMMLLLSDSTAF